MPKYLDVLTIEQALIKAGNGHQFQKRALIIIGLQYMIAGMLHIAMTELFFHQQQYKCLSEDLNYSNCTEGAFCEQYKTRENKVSLVDHSDLGSLIKYFLMVCGDKIQIFILVTSYYIGGSMGSLYYGEQMEIRQGRYTVMIETLLMMGFACCISMLSPSAYILSVALFAINFFSRGFFNSSMILFFEISSENLQKFGPALLLTCYGIGEVISPRLIEMFNLNWQYSMLLLFGLPAVLFSVLIKFMQESPRILVIRRKFEEARLTINYIASVNEREMPENWILEDEVRINELKDKMKNILLQVEIHEQPKGYNFSSIFRYKSIRIRMFCLLYLYSIVVLGQFQTAKEIERFSRLERHHTYLLLSLVSTAGYLISGYASLNYLRKEVIKAILILGAIFHFLIAALPLLILNKTASDLITFYDKLVYTFIMMVLVMCRLTLSFAYGFINVYALEIFPTSLRHYGFCGLTFLTEFLFIFQDSYVIFCHAFGLNSSIGMFALLLLGLLTLQKLRETQDLPLKENVDEMQDELINNIYSA
ncbi:unnamed protein product [Paramecium octaurelia]|uniref:Uncharacterized protein n=1 Tax=Paramecium octaurelia TaxID=43137 RepID=A0A8S1U7S6_PAROT|nr:unnamed protein product [Paramecium octaurelia]